MDLSIDFIVTRKETDPVQYRDVVKRTPEFKLLEVPFAESCEKARRDLINIGTSEYLCWFDPDDTLYSNVLNKIVDYLKVNLDTNGVITLSDYEDDSGKLRQVDFSKCAEIPVHSHGIKVYRRDFLKKALAVVTDDVICWQLAVYGIVNGLTVLPYSAFRWNVNKTDRVNHESRKLTREVIEKARKQIDLMTTGSNGRKWWQSTNVNTVVESKLDFTDVIAVEEDVVTLEVEPEIVPVLEDAKETVKEVEMVVEKNVVKKKEPQKAVIKAVVKEVVVKEEEIKDVEADTIVTEVHDNKP